jgi:hypothetical protein
MRACDPIPVWGGEFGETWRLGGQWAAVNWTIFGGPEKAWNETNFVEVQYSPWVRRAAG